MGSLGGLGQQVLYDNRPVKHGPAQFARERVRYLRDLVRYMRDLAILRSSIYLI